MLYEIAFSFYSCIIVFKYFDHSFSNNHSSNIFCFNKEFHYIQKIDINTVFIFTNPSARAGYDTRSTFKRSLTGLNSEFSFS